MSIRQDHPWPTKPASKKLMHDIRQIVYCIRDDIPEAKPGLVAILSMNTYTLPLRKPTLWRVIPATYSDHVLRILHRNIHLFLAFDMISSGKVDTGLDSEELRDHISRHIAYNDIMLDRLWEEARTVNHMTPEWRSPSLDRWLVIDYHIGDHTDFALEHYAKANGATALHDDPMELGV
jgi:hypothetical protein